MSARWKVTPHCVPRTESFVRKLYKPWSGDEIMSHERDDTNWLKRGKQRQAVALAMRKPMTSKEICEILGSSEKVIAFHRQNIRKKLGLRNKKINLKSYLAAKV